MSRTSAGTRWFDFYPVTQNLLLPPSSPHQTHNGDRGGGGGHDLLALKKAYPDLRGKMLLQDIPIVVKSIALSSLPEGISAQPHDFFAPQPVRGAKCYYIAHVLHDWPDKQASAILQHIRDAMTPGYSVLLINEQLLPDEKVSLMSASVDLAMMANFSAGERTRGQFEELLWEVGLELVGVWQPEVVEVGSDTVLEAGGRGE